MSELQIAVLAGGLATRLGEMARQKPKSMIDVGGKPFLQYQLELFKRRGIHRVLLCVGHLGKQIEDFFGNGNWLGMHLQYSYEEKPLGTAGALKNAESMLDNEFFTIYGDSYLFVDFYEVWNYFQSRKKLALMTVYKNQDLYGSSNTEVQGELVRAFSKKSKTPDMVYIEYGLNYFRKDVLEQVPKDCFFELGDVFNQLIPNEQLLAYEVKDRFYEIGSISGYEAFNEFIKVKT